MSNEPEWFRKMSKAQQRAYLKAHPASKLGQLSNLARKAYNSKLGQEVVNVSVGYAAQSVGLSNLDAARNGELPKVEVKAFKPGKPKVVKPRVERVKPVASKATSTQAERVKRSKQRASKQRGRK